MLKYTTGEDGTFSPHQHKENLIRNIHLSSTSKAEPKMAIKKRGGKRLARGAPPDPPLLPPIQSGSPHGFQLSNDRQEAPANLHNSHSLSNNRKEIRTPYVAHLGINRISDVATPYVLHTQVSKLERSSPLGREASKLSNNVLELKQEHPPELRQEPTFSSLQKFGNSNSPTLDKRPRGRYGRGGKGIYEDPDSAGPKLQIQSSQAGLYQRASKKDRPRGRDESFSIRKKIEQFRRWHEEQYTEKLKKLKQEVDHQYVIEQNRVNQQQSRLSRKSPSTAKKETMAEYVVEKDSNGKQPQHQQHHHHQQQQQQNMVVDVSEKMDADSSERSHEKMDTEKETRADVSATTDTKPRTESARTWHTWRDVNESYAYSDVKKYIKDNELMDPEKEHWIRKWVIEVNKSMRDDRQDGHL